MRERWEVTSGQAEFAALATTSSAGVQPGGERSESGVGVAGQVSKRRLRGDGWASTGS